MNDPLATRIEAVRRFNRFYTRQLGLLDEKLLSSPFSLAEARVMYEIAQAGTTTATSLGKTLGLDGGYLSRMLHRFKKLGLVDPLISPTDRRRVLLRLTRDGEEAFTRLNAGSQGQIESLLAPLSTGDQNRLVDSMGAIERLLGDVTPRLTPAIILRPLQPGDLGWVVHRHGVLYAQEYGWDETFEALVAQIAADFVTHRDPRRENAWIAERDGAPVGSVFLVKKTDKVAKLRLLLVEPGARGLGIGRRLVEETIRFARQAGYRRITLWTNSILTAARAIYAKAGFTLTETEPNTQFGHDLVSETWDLEL
jgi:DNA-binding MarR family transcriptional regulator/GNAT superfamily N-acetyltransferase